MSREKRLPWRVDLKRIKHGAGQEPDEEGFRGFIEARPWLWRIIPGRSVMLVCPHEHPNTQEAADCAHLQIQHITRILAKDVIG